MQKAKKLTKFWLPVILWALIIFFFSNRPSIYTVDFYLGDFLLKKSAHIVEYAIFGILVFRAFLSHDIDKKKALLISIVIASFYGITDEFHQSFISGRTATIRDTIIDTIGAIIGVNICKTKF